MEKKVTLETTLMLQRSSLRCDCEYDPILHIAQRVYMACAKCGIAMSKGITLEEAQEIQSRY